MPPNSLLEQQVESLLSPARKPVVPLACLHDQSEFACTVAQRLQQLFLPPYDKALVQGPVGQYRSLLARLFEAGLRQRLMPLVLWEHQAFWVVWVLEGKAEVAALAQTSGELERAHQGKLRHILILKAQPDFGIANLRQCLDSRTEWVCCILANEGEIKRPDRHLALAAAAWLFAGWERFCAQTTGQFREALWLPPDVPVVTLGCSLAEVDRRYHASRWAHKLAEEVRQKWTEQVGSEDQPQFPKLKELLRLLLPYLDKWLTTEQAAYGAQVQMQDEAAGILSRELAPEPPRRQRASASSYLSQLQALRRKFHILTFFRLEPARHLIQAQAPALGQAIQTAVKNALRLPQQPNSLLYRLRLRLGFAQQYAQRLQDVCGSADRGGSFEAEFEAARRQISAVPTPLGLALRLSLVLLALAWLVVGQILWHKPLHWANDPLLQGIGLYAALASGFLVLGTLAHLFQRHRLVWRAIDRLEANLLYRHHAEITRLLAAAIKSQGEALTQQLTTWQNQAQDLATALANPWLSGDQLPKNECPIVDDTSVDSLLEPKLPQLLSATHAHALQSLSTDSGPNFRPSEWQAALQQAARTLADEYVSRLGFETCVQAANRPSGQRQLLFGSLVQEARAPAWKPASAIQPTTVCFGSESWRACCGPHDTVVFHPVPCPELIAVSVVPVQTVN